MNSAALFFASGDSLYLGAITLLVAVAISGAAESQTLRRLQNSLAWSGLALLVMACPPFPWIVDILFAVSFVTWSYAANVRRTRVTSLQIRRAAAAALVFLLLLLPATELFRRRTPLITGQPCDHLVVIGDSISAGMDASVPPWPIVFQQKTGIPVRNLSRPGAQVNAAVNMTASVQPEDLVVLIEIGGNDLLSDIPSTEFERSLDALLSQLAAPRRTIVMFELPLLPHRTVYGQVQRHLATKYNVSLIPKHYFTGVLRGADATSDGLHLTKAGADRMASLVAQVLLPVLKKTA